MVWEQWYQQGGGARGGRAENVNILLGGWTGLEMSTSEGQLRITGARLRWFGHD